MYDICLWYLSNGRAVKVIDAKRKFGCSVMQQMLMATACVQKKSLHILAPPPFHFVRKTDA